MEKDKDLLELKDMINNQKKHKKHDKIFESKKIDNIINKILNIYNKIYQELFIKLDFKNDLKQGKFFTILISIILFISLTLILFLLFNSLFGLDLILINSILSLNLIFYLFKYSFFSLSLLYKIIKNKGLVIKKYLSKLFPQSEILKENQNEFQVSSNFSNLIFREVNNLIKRIDKMNLTLDEEKDLALKLKEIVLLVQEEDGTIEHELDLLEVKKKITNKLSQIEYFLNNKEIKGKQQKEFSDTRDLLVENLDDIIEKDVKSYQKRLVK